MIDPADVAFFEHRAYDRGDMPIDPVNIRGREMISPQRGEAKVVVDTGYAPLAVFAPAGAEPIDLSPSVYSLRYQEADRKFGLLGYPLHLPATNGGVAAMTIPAGKIVALSAPGTLFLDRDPPEWPPEGF